jgi:hypothetical protein
MTDRPPCFIAQLRAGLFRGVSAIDIQTEHALGNFRRTLAARPRASPVYMLVLPWVLLLRR